MTAIAVLSYMMQTENVLPVPEEILFDAVAFGLIVVKAFILLEDIYLLEEAEDLVCFVFLGGAIDALFKHNVRQATRRKSTLIN